MTGSKPEERDDYVMDWKGRRPADEAVARRMEDPAWMALVDRISDADRDWFLAHPTRRCRVRPLRTDEQPMLEPGVNWHVIVLQVRPGMRVRHYVELLDLAPDDDELLYRTAMKGLREGQPDLWRGIVKIMALPPSAGEVIRG
jgi:hypothetical protein